MAGILLICLAGAAVLAALYFLIYKTVINRRLARGARSGRRLPGPAAALLVFLAAALLVWGALAAAGRAVNPGLDARYADADYDLQVWTAQQMRETYRAAYSADENPGYEKTVVTDGDVTFTVFESDAGYDRLHPMYVIYAAYTGGGAVDSTGYAGRYLTADGREICGIFAAGGGEPDEYMCFFASAETDCVLRAEVFYYDRAGAAELKGRGGEEGATDELLRSCAMAAGTLELAVNP